MLYGSEYLATLAQDPAFKHHLGLLYSAYNAGTPAVGKAMTKTHTTSLSAMLAYYEAHPSQTPRWLRQEEQALHGSAYGSMAERYLIGRGAGVWRDRRGVRGAAWGGQSGIRRRFTRWPEQSRRPADVGLPTRTEGRDRGHDLATH